MYETGGGICDKYFYDENGNLSYMENAAGHCVFKYSYDENNNLIYKEYLGGPKQYNKYIVVTK